MRTIFTADWHIGCDPHHDEDLKRAVKAMRKCKPHELVIAGDLFHRNNPSAAEIALALDMLSEFCNFAHGPERWDAIIHVIAGNHDAGITRSLNSDLLDVRFRSNCSTSPSGPSQLIFCPHGTVGLVYSMAGLLGAVVIMHGYPPGYRPKYMQDDSDYDVLDNVPSGVCAVIAGHCHGVQDYMHQGARIIIPGAPTPVTFGEEGQIKGWFMQGDGGINFVGFSARKMQTMDLSRQKEFTESAMLGGFTGKGAARLILPASMRMHKRFLARRLKELGHDSVKILFEREPARPEVRLHDGADHVGAWIRANVPELIRADVARAVAVDVNDRGVSVSGEQRKIELIKIENYRSIKNMYIELKDSGCLGVVGEASGNKNRSNGQGKSSVLLAIADAFCGAIRASDLSGGHVLVKIGGIGHVTMKQGQSPRYTNLGDHDRKTFCEYNLIGPRSLLNEQAAERLKLLLEDLPERMPLKKVNARLKKELREKQDALLKLLGRSAQLAPRFDADQIRFELGELIEKQGATESGGKLMQAELTALAEGIEAREKLDRLAEIKNTHPDLEFSEEKLDRLRRRCGTYRENEARYDETISSISASGSKISNALQDINDLGTCPVSDQITCPLRGSDRAALIQKLFQDRGDLEIQLERANGRKVRANLFARNYERKIQALECNAEIMQELQALTEIEPELRDVAVAAPGLQAARNKLNKLSAEIEESDVRLYEIISLIGGHREKLRQAEEDHEEHERVGQEVTDLENEIKILECAAACSADCCGAINLALQAHVDRINRLMEAVATDFDWWQQPLFELRLTEGKPELWGRFADRFRPWSTFSQGERSAANLVFQLSRREIREERDGIFPLLMVDEALDNLDGDNYERAVDYLKRCGYQVLLVSHNPRLRELTDCVVVGGQ